MLLRQPRLQHLVQPQGHVGVLGGIGGRLVDRHPVEGDLGLAAARHVGELDRLVAQMQLGQFVHAVAMGAALQHVGDQHGVVDRRDGDAFLGEHHRVVLDVLADLQHARVFQQRLEAREDRLLGELLRPVAVQVQSARATGAGVTDRDVAGLAGLDGERDAHQGGEHGLNRRGLGVEGHEALRRGRVDPHVERIEAQDGVVAGGLDLLGRLRRLRAGRRRTAAGA